MAEVDLRCMSVKANELDMVRELVNQGYFLSVSEFFRYGLLLYLNNPVNPAVYLFRNPEIEHNGKRKPHFSMKMTNRFYSLIKDYSRSYQTTVSAITRVAMDMAIQHFQEILHQHEVIGDYQCCPRLEVI